MKIQINYLTATLVGIICFLVGLFFGKRDNQRYILVEKSTGIGGHCKELRYISLYYNPQKIYNDKNPQLEDENHFFVPLNKNKQYLNRTVYHNIHLDNSVSYDHNGYYAMSNKEIKKAFKKAYKYNSQLYKY